MTTRGERLRMGDTLKLLDEAREIIADMEGQRLNVEGSNNKEIMRAKALVSRNLLYAAHITDLARADIMNQYHRFKGENPPQILP